MEHGARLVLQCSACPGDYENPRQPSAADLDAIAEEEHVREMTEAPLMGWKLAAVWIALGLFCVGVWVPALHWFLPIVRDVLRRTHGSR